MVLFTLTMKNFLNRFNAIRYFIAQKCKCLQSGICNLNPEGSGMAQWLYVAVTQGPERRFEFSDG